MSNYELHELAEQLVNAPNQGGRPEAGRAMLHSPSPEIVALAEWALGLERELAAKAEQ